MARKKLLDTGVEQDGVSQELTGENSVSQDLAATDAISPAEAYLDSVVTPAVLDEPMLRMDEPAVTPSLDESTAATLEELPTDAEPDPDREDRMPTIPQLLIAIALLAGVLGFPTAMQFISKTSAQAEPTSQPAQVQEAAPAPVEQAQPPQEAQDQDPFASVSLQAKAAYVWDVKEQRALFSQSASTQLPLASLTKLMTALVAYETYHEGDTVPITLSAISQDGENGFEDGEVWDAFKLLDFTLMTSSNDGAFALAAAAGALSAQPEETPEEVFVERMNQKAEEIGLLQTYFTNPTGLDESESESGSYGSARDMAFLMEYIIRHAPRILSHTTEMVATFADQGGKTFTATNTNDHISEVEGALGSKTGYTVLAGGNLAIAFEVEKDHPIVITVLGSSREGRFTDVEALRSAVIAHFNTETP